VSNRILRRVSSPAWHSNASTDSQPLPSYVLAARLERPFLLFGADGAPVLAFFAMGSKHLKRLAALDVPETTNIAVGLGSLRASPRGPLGFGVTT
jgi:hypothetical protein